MNNQKRVSDTEFYSSLSFYGQELKKIKPFLEDGIEYLRRAKQTDNPHDFNQAVECLEHIKQLMSVVKDCKKIE